MKRSAIMWASLGIVVAVALFLWKPTVLVYGLQRAGLYAAVAIPMALVLGVVHIVNLSHGEFMMVAAYATYFAAKLLGIDPLVAMVPVGVVMAVFGFVIYRLTIRKALKAPELNQLILTFGLGIALSQAVNLAFSSQSWKLSLDYVTASATIGKYSFGTYDFIFVAAAIALAAGLKLFLTRTRMGKAALAVGQNPRGAAIVGIDVDRTYAFVFSLAVGLVGIMGSLFLTKQAIFPTVGGPYTMKSFCLVAMAGVGNITGVLWGSIALGVAEVAMTNVRELRDWSSIVFFVIIIATILARAIKERSA
ncbi:MAG TPA: branched-chain amino acid ABC transporter permease [Rectinemataceae bacterium]|nr:branched-chain amino acid ABC transporter permease [Rectinemataceae bacterium]